jgi:hypothetical protein
MWGRRMRGEVEPGNQTFRVTSHDRNGELKQITKTPSLCFNLGRPEKLG